MLQGGRGPVPRPPAGTICAPVLAQPRGSVPPLNEEDSLDNLVGRSCAEHDNSGFLGKSAFISPEIHK